MFEGQMVKTGACAQKKINHGNEENSLNIGDGSNNVSAKCVNRESDI